MKLFFIIFGAVAFLGVGLLVGYLLWKQNFLLQQYKPSQQVSKEITVLTPTEIPSVFTGTYKKRQFVPTDGWIPNIKYPDELTTILDENLVGLSCRQYSLNGSDPSPKNYFYTDEATKQKISLVSDTNSLQLFERAKEDIKGQILSMVICGSQEDTTIVGYITVPEESSDNTSFTTRYGLVNPGGKYTVLLELPPKEYPNYKCLTPLLLTANDILYVACGGGEGSKCDKGDDIYKIEIPAKVHSVILSCTTSQKEVVDGCKTTCVEATPTPIL